MDKSVRIVQAWCRFNEGKMSFISVGNKIEQCN